MKPLRRWMPMILATVAVVALGAYWILSAVAPVASAPARAGAFALPAKLHADPDTLVASLTRFDPWGLGSAAYARAQPDKGNGAAPAPWVPWSLTGSYSIGGQSFVLIRFDNKTAEPLKVGDSLPGGARILDIQQDKLCILIDGKRRALAIGTR